ncbi:MAG: hypothetical protein RBT63_02835, partial [Bdellovibrionales bacterium]|nr:hypothetical protein [Bdellovibrionales bacterium]
MIRIFEGIFTLSLFASIPLLSSLLVPFLSSLLVSTANADEKPAAAPVSNDESYAYSYAIKNLDHIMIDNKAAYVLPSKWTHTLTAGNRSTYTSKDGSMQFDIRYLENGEDEFITFNKRNQKATITVFNENKPVSHTMLTE